MTQRSSAANQADSATTPPEKLHPRPRRRWYHLGTRTVVLGLCVLVAAWQAYKKFREPIKLSLGLIREVRFPDPKLEAEIRRMCGKSEGVITDKDVAALDDVLWLPEIHDLTGIDQCVNLRELRLRSVSCKIPSLSSLTKLEVLAIGTAEQPEDALDGIDQCVNLRELQLGSLSCNLPSLGRLANLQVLEIGTNRFEDVFESIRLCVNLQELRVWGGEPTDMTPLASLTHLRFLDLRINLHPLAGSSADLTPLQGLTNLEVLSLWGFARDNKRPLDLTPLRNLNKLWDLRLQLNQIEDLSPLSRLTNLVELQLGANRISDLRPLTSLQRLQVLLLDGNKIRDVDPLAALASLQWLSLEHNQVDDVERLAKMPALKRLAIGRNQIQDISSLAGLQHLGEPMTLLQHLGEPMTFVSRRSYKERSRVWHAESGTLNEIYCDPDGPALDLTGNPLNDDAYQICIPALRAKGVKVLTDKESLSNGRPNE